MWYSASNWMVVILHSTQQHCLLFIWRWLPAAASGKPFGRLVWTNWGTKNVFFHFYSKSAHPPVYLLMSPGSSVEHLSFVIGNSNCSILRLAKPELTGQFQDSCFFILSALPKVGLGQQEMGCLLSAEPSRDDPDEARAQAAGQHAFPTSRTYFWVETCPLLRWRLCPVVIKVRPQGGQQTEWSRNLPQSELAAVENCFTAG